MKQTVFLFFKMVLVVMLITGCSSGKHSNDYLSDIREISINPNSRQTGKLTLSEIVESVTYVPLETNDNCLLSDISRGILSENYVLLSCRKTRRCYFFTKTGRFIAQIGDIGQGPGEYPVTPDPVYIDEKHNQVIIHDHMLNKLLYYDFNGRFIKQISFGVLHTASSVSYHTDFYLLKTANFGKAAMVDNIPYTYTIFDDNHEIITQKIRPVPFSMNPPNSMVSGGTSFCQYIYDNQVHVRENMLNDTLYRINHDFSFIPKYILNAGKYEMTVEIRSNVALFQQEGKNCPLITSMFETEDYLLLSYMYLQEYKVLCYYHKKSDKLIYFSSSTGIPNDYDDGLDFWPQFQFNNQLIAFYNAYRITDHIEKEKNVQLKGSLGEINRFEQMARKINADDNPVMVILNLKL
jgi:hypothetical protein